MEWHWYYIIGIVWFAETVWAFIITKDEPIDEQIEQMWRDNF